MFDLSLGTIGNVKIRHTALHVGTGVLSLEECALLPTYACYGAMVVTCLPFVLFG